MKCTRTQWDKLKILQMIIGDVFLWNVSKKLVISCARTFTGGEFTGDCSLVRRFCRPKVRESEIKGSSFRSFCSPKVRKSDNDFYSFLL